MTSNHVNKSLLGNYKINDVDVDIYFMPRVIEAFASQQEVQIVNKVKYGEKFEIPDLENHFNNIFELVKSRILKYETYEMFFDTINYLNQELKWKSHFNEKTMMIEIYVNYSEMNCPEYQDEINKALQELCDAEERGEDVDEYIRRQFEANKDNPKKPKIVGSLPVRKNTLH
ncbi:hypothetical protein N8725_02730 [Alphaproteobacteria bacterium]|nr:hypothetical protein [Alphaproteobacteria bacterium]